MPDYIYSGDEEAGSYFESDSCQGKGWRGQWVDELFDKHEKGEPLSVHKLQWALDKSWGVEVTLEVCALFYFRGICRLTCII
jgi:hypothetical protein